MIKLYYEENLIGQYETLKMAREDIKAKDLDKEKCRLVETYIDEETNEEEELTTYEQVVVGVFGDDTRRGVDDKHLKIMLINNDEDNSYLVDEYLVDYVSTNKSELKLAKDIENISREITNEYRNHNGLLPKYVVEEIVNQYR